MVGLKKNYQTRVFIAIPDPFALIASSNPHLSSPPPLSPQASKRLNFNFNSITGPIIHTKRKTNTSFLHTRNCWSSFGHKDYPPLPVRKHMTNILKDVCPPGRGPGSQFPGTKVANYILKPLYNLIHFRSLCRVILYHVANKRPKELKAWVSTNGCRNGMTLKSLD